MRASELTSALAAASRPLRAALVGLAPCPGCSSRPADERGCCASCWTAVQEPQRHGDVIAVGRYHGALGALLRAGKFGGATVALHAIGTRLGELLTEAGLADAPLVPVPSHPRRRRKRGPDPAYRLAAAASPRVHACLVRVRDDPPQSRTVGARREANVRSAFGFARGCPLPQGASVVLVDDVLTSGATARACAAALASRGVGVRAVAVAAVA
jgi:predicted amidophosphoribosyltransferase